MDPFEKTDQTKPMGQVGNVVEEKGLQRLISLSDGIFAIAVTLAVFQLVPGNFEQKLQSEGAFKFIAGLSSGILSLIISFIVAGMYWIAHHRIFSRVKSAPRTLLILNLVFLLGITLVPFSTELLNASAEDSGAVVVYAGNMAFIGASLWVIWFYLNRHSELHEFSREEMKQEGIRIVIPPLLFVISIAIAWLNPTAAKYFWILIAFSKRISYGISRFAGDQK